MLNWMKGLTPPSSRTQAPCYPSTYLLLSGIPGADDRATTFLFCG